ncbi:ankyrin repeat-containing domain protein [Xylaria digitata]|nr:ankyrin repeat-containing domain protein [Xylaria digitata]
MALTQRTVSKDIDRVKESLRGTPNTTDRDIRGMTDPHRAAENGEIGVVKDWGNQDTFTAKDNYGKVPMYYTAANGHEGIVQALAEATDIDQQDNFGRTALHWAAENNHASIVKLLIEKKANVNQQDRSEQTALSRAAWRGWEDILWLLLQHGAEYHLPDRNGNIALRLTVNNGHKKAANMLFGQIVQEGKADVNCQSAAEKVLKQPWRETLRFWDPHTMLWAARNEYERVMQRLREGAFQVDIRFPYDHRYPQDQHDSQTINGWTVLQATARTGDLDAVNRLLEAQADPNAAPAKNSGLTALQAAATEGHLEVVNRLLEVGAEVREEAIEFAANAGHQDVERRPRKAKDVVQSA